MVIRPIVSYASVVWWPKCNQATVKRLLEGVQRMACCCMVAAMRTTPTAAMEAILGLLPLDLFLKKRAMETAERLTRAKLWHTYGTVCGHRSIVNIASNSIYEWDMTKEGITRVKVAEPFHRTLILDGKEPIRNEGEIVIYTDASWMEGRAVQVSSRKN